MVYLHNEKKRSVCLWRCGEDFPQCVGTGTEIVSFVLALNADDTWNGVVRYHV